MKKSLIIALLAITSLGASAQPPRQLQGQRPLPNQFRDFVDHQQKFEKPQIQHKDGKVIITMTEEQFRHMQQMRMQHRPGIRPISIQQQGCLKCDHRHKSHLRRKRA
jgi:hypothetical protein